MFFLRIHLLFEVLSGKSQPTAVFVSRSAALERDLGIGGVVCPSVCLSVCHMPVPCHDNAHRITKFSPMATHWESTF